MTHTPGPWKLRQSDEMPWVIEGKDAFPVAVLTGLRQPAKANAQLLAAAPEMLVALDKLTHVNGVMRAGTPEHRDALIDAYDAAIDAINKAKGRPQA